MTSEDTINAMRAKILKDFGNAFLANDTAHRATHFWNVEQCGRLLNDRLGLGFDPKLIMLAAHFHDMFAWSRNNHDLLSAKWVLTTDYPAIVELDKHDRKLVSWACRQHRASFKGHFVHKFAELFNAADREVPGDVKAMIERAVQFRMAKGLTREEAYGPAVEHIKEKYGAVVGYARYPQLYLDVFGDELAAQRRIIDNL